MFILKTLFWTLIFLIGYTYVGYPLILTLMGIIKTRDVKKKDIHPVVSLIIAAYNEEGAIEAKIQNSLALDYEKDKLEIIVASDGSTDKTDEIVKNYRDDNVILYRVEGRVGKTETRNRAVKIAKGEIIVFSDATTTYQKDAIRKMVRNFNDPQVGLVSGRYKYINPEGAPLGLGSIIFWNYENFIKCKQSKIKTLTGASGCINSFRKELYEPLPPEIIEDFVEPLKILKKGYRVVFEPEALAYEPALGNARQEFRMRVRLISGGMRGLWFVKGILNPTRFPFESFQLFSHKVLRWSIPFFMIGLIITNIFLLRESWPYGVIFGIQALFYLLAGLGLISQILKVKVKVFSFPLYFCTLNFACLVAFIKTLTGKKYITWETAR